MSKKSPAKPQPRAAQIPFNGFVPCNMGKAEEEMFDKRKDADRDYFVDILVAGQDMLKFSFGWKEGLGAYQASFQSINPASSSYGMMLSAFSDDGHEAIALLFFKHEVILERDWGQPVEREFGQRRRG